MEGSGGDRPAYATLPDALHEQVHALLGGPVVTATTQAGGFSPGVAARVVTHGGRRAFVKAVDGSVNEHSPTFMRREVDVLRQLPPVPWRPRLIGPLEHESWAGLVVEDVMGRTPRLPWQSDELARVQEAMCLLAREAAPRGLPSATTAIGQLAGSWQRAVEEHLRTGFDWADAHLDVLAAAEAGCEAAVAGDRLVHLDLRADNVLLTPDRVVFVDWPHACAGNPVLDAVAAAPSVALQGGPSPEEYLAALPHGVSIDERRLRPLVVAIAGYFAVSAALPDPPGLPTLRAFQRSQAGVALAWVRRLLADELST